MGNNQIFISYARKDAEEFAKRLHEDLKNDLDIWWDRADMESRGRPFQKEIETAIDNSKRIIAVISPVAFKSDYVRFEWDYAYINEKIIVPILLKGDYESIPDKFNVIRSIDQYQKLPHELTASEFSNLHITDFSREEKYQAGLKELKRILKSEVFPLGKLLGEHPSIPRFYFPRDKEMAGLVLKVLPDTQLPKVIKFQDRTVALHGRGGSGKTILAAAFARSIPVRRFFEDGIFWLHMGRDEVNLARGLRELGTTFLDEPIKHDSLESLKDTASKALEDKRCLIILDDVWDSGHAFAFMEASGPHCRLLITTRYKRIPNELGVPMQALKELSKDEALEFMASWAYKTKEDLTDKAKDVVKECDKLPLALALCGILARGKRTWEDVLKDLNEVNRQSLQRKLPAYSPKEIDVFTPLEVSLNALKAIDEEERKTADKCFNRYQHYLDLAVLPEGEQTAETVVLGLWLYKNGLDESALRDIVCNLDERALLQLIDSWPLSSVKLHNLQQDYIRSIVKNVKKLHKEIGRSLLDWWLASGAGSNLEQDQQKRSYVIKYLISHLVKAQEWKDLEKLLINVEYLELRQSPSEQFEFQQEFLSLLSNPNVPFNQISRILKSVLNSIVELMELGNEKADWLDTFAYWITKFCGDGELSGTRKPKDIARLREISKSFNSACGRVSHELIEDKIGKEEYNWAMRYAELETWAYQSAGFFQECVEACLYAEEKCQLQQIPEGYTYLGKAEFIRMRAYASNRLLEKEKDAGQRTKYEAEASRAYDFLNDFFSNVKQETWKPVEEDWKTIERSLVEDSSELPKLSSGQVTGEPASFKAIVVSNAHDCISAIHIIQFLQDQKGEVEWIHHEHFNPDDFASSDRLFTILLGGPKSPNISEVADKFYEVDPTNYLRMYSGLHCEEHQLKIEEGNTHCYMLGGISKINTLKAAYDFTKDQEVNEIINRAGAIRT